MKTTNEYQSQNYILSAQEIEILKMLYHFPAISHGMLAQALEISPSNLSNRIKEISSAAIFIHTETVGRNKIYSLTEIGKSHIKQIIRIYNSRISDLLQRTLCAEEANLVHVLSNFKLQHETDWPLLIDDYLLRKLNVLCNTTTAGNQDQMTTDRTSASDTELNDFFNKIEQLIVSEQQTHENEILELLGDHVLILRAKKMLKKSLDNFFMIKPLIELDKKNHQTAIKAIDSVFSEMYPNIFSQIYDGNADSEIYKIVTKLDNEFQRSLLTKATAIEHWQTMYRIDSYDILNHIAEKLDRAHQPQ